MKRHGTSVGLSGIKTGITHARNPFLHRLLLSSNPTHLDLLRTKDSELTQRECVITRHDSPLLPLQPARPFPSPNLVVTYTPGLRPPQVDTKRSREHLPPSSPFLSPTLRSPGPPINKGSGSTAAHLKPKAHSWTSSTIYGMEQLCLGNVSLVLRPPAEN